MSDRTCPECGVKVSGHGSRKYCADICKSRAKEKVRAATGYYQQACIKDRQSNYARSKYRQDVASGKAKGDGSRLVMWQDRGASGLTDLPTRCVVSECTRATFARLKCQNHYIREMLSEGAEWAAEYFTTGRNDYQRRAERFGVEFVEISRLDIFERDGWLCGICSEPVDPRAIYPDPMSVSLDHIRPLSRGGGHTPENVQCSHLSCNVRKGARYGESATTAAA